MNGGSGGRQNYRGFARINADQEKPTTEARRRGEKSENLTTKDTKEHKGDCQNCHDCQDRRNWKGTSDRWLTRLDPDWDAGGWCVSFISFAAPCASTAERQLPRQRL